MLNPANTWQIEHQCPQCGAPVELGEAERLLLCPFCRTNLQLATKDYFRYYIPAKNHDPREITYIPYWRLRGLSFTVVTTGSMGKRFFDTNVLALLNNRIPHSLGLRPQVLKLKFITSELPGRILEPEISADKVLQDMAPPSARCHQVFIGEMISLIYAPVYVEKEMLYDGVLKTPLCSLRAEDRDSLPARKPSKTWNIRFLPTLCPQCGWDLQGERDSLVLVCLNCKSAWACRKETFERISFATVAEDQTVTHYLPFWRIKPRIEGINLASYADLVRLANLPKAITPAWEATPLLFFSPAFKVNPALFLRWSRQMTISPPEEATMETFPRTTPHPVTLPASEAVQNIIVTIANLARDKRKLLATLSGIRITLEETILEYHPFTMSRNELVHTKSGFTMDSNALAFGAEL